MSVRSLSVRVSEVIEKILVPSGKRLSLQRAMLHSGPAKPISVYDSLWMLFLKEENLSYC